MEEKRRRAERNESILRTMERIDYQASTLAAKTERLRALKVRACNMKNLQTTFVSCLLSLKSFLLLSCFNPFFSYSFGRAEAIREIFIEFVEPKTSSDLSSCTSKLN